MVSSDLEVVSEKFTGAQEGHQRPRLINRNRTATKYVTPKLNKVNGVTLNVGQTINNFDRNLAQRGQADYKSVL